MVQFCANDQLVEYDCATLFPDNPASCGEVSAEWGFDCLIDNGAECLYANGGTVVTTFCEDEGACVIDIENGTSACVADVGLYCDPDENGEANNARCEGNTAFHSCTVADSFVGLACGFGSTCNSGRCDGVEEDGRCDPAGVTSTCADDLVCDDNGICRPTTLEPEPEPSPNVNGGCASIVVDSAEIPTSAFFVLGVVALLRRRRNGEQR